ncbi:hypothetical protein HYE68_008970 [Fusarium pseudograminearum]|nr:hypothetical protein HYE68_008970 [Fusarium pseudograminearum]
MARHGFIALLATTILSISVHAGPCKPYSSAALSSITINIESTATASSTDIDTTDALQITTTEASTDVTDITEVPETSTTEAATDATGNVETTTTEISTAVGATDIFETTTTEIATDTTKTLEITATETTAFDTTESLEASSTESATGKSATTAESTTTTVPEPACVPTEILVNPSFDDNNDGSPWTLGQELSIGSTNPQSPPNALYITVTGSRTRSSITQTLPALSFSAYKLQYAYKVQPTENKKLWLHHYCQGQQTNYVLQHISNRLQRILSDSESFLPAGSRSVHYGVPQL